MSNELIVVKQLPVIEDQLRQVKANIQERVALALSLACTEDTYKEVKRERAALAKEYKALEERRKEVKRAILAPYESFEALYKECAGDIYMEADRKLRDRISEVEGGLRQQKTDDVKAFFDEYRASQGIDADFVTFTDSEIRVGMSDSKKSLREKAITFLDRIADDLALIATMDDKDEILIEYKNDLNVSHAVTTVSARHKAIEEERRRREAAAEERAARARAEAEVKSIIEEETLVAPNPAPVPESSAIPAEERGEDQEFRTTFTVWGTLAQLKALKTFLNDGGYRYE